MSLMQDVRLIGPDDFPVQGMNEIHMVEEGDIIAIDIMANTINMKVSEDELARRRAAWKPRKPRITTGYLSRYAALVTSGNTGAILKVPDEE